MKPLITIYKQVLKLLPVTYRNRYAEPMVHTLEDMIADQQNPAAKLIVWLRTMLDLPITTVNQYIQTGGITMNQAPNYARRGTLLSAVLLLPFLITIAFNSIRPLTGSWIEMGYLSVFILPVIALSLGIVVLVKLLVSHDLWTRLKSIKQLQNNWMLFAVPLLAFTMVAFAFGHDRVHCLVDGHPAQLAQCVINN